MKLKLDDQGHAVLQDGKPVYVKDDGTDVAFDAPGTVATIGRLNAEAKAHRERAEAAEGKLKGFDGIDDPEAARKALHTVSNLDAKKLVDSGEIDKVRAEVGKSYQAKLDAETAKAQALTNQLYSEMVGGAFARSKFVAEKLAIPPDLVQARFGGAFGIENGKVVAKDAQGNVIFSRANPGEPAGFDEALDTLVNAYPHKDSILKGTGASGGGAQGNRGSGGGTTGADWSTANTKERVAILKAKHPNLGKE